MNIALNIDKFLKNLPIKHMKDHIEIFYNTKEFVFRLRTNIHSCKGLRKKIDIG